MKTAMDIVEAPDTCLIQGLGLGPMEAGAAVEVEELLPELSSPLSVEIPDRSSLSRFAFLMEALPRGEDVTGAFIELALVLVALEASPEEESVLLGAMIMPY